MNEHGLGHWIFQWDRAKTRFGACHHLKRMITLSEHLVALNDVGVVRNTILHEIAHALVGPKHNHDWEWKNRAKSIGCSGDRCYSSTETQTPTSLYVAICTTCNKEHKAHRRRKRLTACTACCDKYNRGKFDTRFLLQFKERRVAA